MSYNILTNGLRKLDLSGKKVLVLGAGSMAREYCKTLSLMGISDATIVSRSENSARDCASSYGFDYRYGGFSCLDENLGRYDLVIDVLPIHELKRAADFLIANGARTILVEKPGSLYSSELKDMSVDVDPSQIRLRLAYNRSLYPNLWKLKELVEKEGGITSCRYTFTEWIHTLDFEKEQQDAYARWGISNSLHVISMAHNLIGLPKEFCALQTGDLPWHPSGSRFVGSGITEAGVPFSYHADWSSAGRWGIEIMTSKNAYQLIPLEDLYVCNKGSVQWNKVDFEKAYPEAKQGLAEEIALMLNPEFESEIKMVDLERAALLTETAEKIFGYSS